jgi:hypothetical protein
MPVPMTSRHHNSKPHSRQDIDIVTDTGKKLWRLKNMGEAMSEP